MDKLYIFVGKNTPVIIALALTIIFLIASVILAVICNPNWINRFGALIIIVGIYLGISRYYDWVEGKAFEIAQSKIEPFVKKSIGSDLEHLTDEEKIYVFDRVKREGANLLINGITDQDRPKLKIWELHLIVFGTFLSGFGDLVYFYLKDLIA